MRQILDRPRTQCASDLSELARSQKVVLWGENPEPRSSLAAGLPDSISVRAESAFEATFKVANDEERVSLRDAEKLGDLLQKVKTKVVIDITGMPHHVWAPLVKQAYSLLTGFEVMYVEPADYARNPNPQAEGDIFELSHEREGVAPLPGFAGFVDEIDDQVVYVPLLGFEGVRAEHIANQYDFKPDRIVPVLPVPGFRLEYPTYTCLCNQSFFLRFQCWNRVELATANCPFAARDTILQIRTKYPGSKLCVALIGTKPHALGAVLAYLAAPESIELIFDYPRKKDKRTTGHGRIFTYEVNRPRERGHD